MGKSNVAPTKWQGLLYILINTLCRTTRRDNNNEINVGGPQGKIEPHPNYLAYMPHCPGRGL